MAEPALSGARVMAEEAAMDTMAAAPQVAEAAAPAAQPAAEQATQYLISDVNILLWFLAGAFLFLASYLFIEYVRKKMREKEK